jgi:hypothetical protein
MKISTVEPVMAIGRFQSIGQNYAANHKHFAILQHMGQLHIVHIVLFLRKRKLLTCHRQDAESLNEQDARNILVYDFRLKWGSNESIMGTRFLQYRNCFLLIIFRWALLPIWHRSALSTHPLRKCVSTLRVIPIGNHHETIVWEPQWASHLQGSISNPEKDLNQKNSLPSIGAGPKLSLHSRVRCWAMEYTFRLHVSFGAIVGC